MATGGEVSAKLHWVLQMLSRRTASTPTSAISWRQLFTRRDWHSAWEGEVEKEEIGGGENKEMGEGEEKEEVFWVRLMLTFSLVQVQEVHGEILLLAPRGMSIPSTLHLWACRG